MPYEFGDVVLVQFPFTDRTTTKQRPSVIVSNLLYNLTRPDVVLMAITSQFRPNREVGDVWINEWQAAGLLKPSVVKAVFATLERRLVIRKFGSLRPADQADVKKAIADVLG